MATEESPGAGGRDATDQSLGPLAALDDRIDGEVRRDAYSRHLYATDASLYREVPDGVVFPRERGEVQTVMRYCAERSLAVLPRGGGTSLAGQAVNGAVIIDLTRHMDRIVDVDPNAEIVTAQPGITLGALNASVDSHNLTFPPDPAWADFSTLGGAIANNSSGAHSLAYGPTDGYIESVEIVFDNGSIATFEPITPEQLSSRADPSGDREGQVYAFLDRLYREERETVTDTMPDLGRNVAGYNLDGILEEDEAGRINPARLFAASEGTLGVITEATVRLEPEPDAVGAALLSFETFEEAMKSVSALLDHDPAAVEAMDDVLLKAAREHPDFAEVASLPPEGASGVLLVEVFGHSPTVVRADLDAILAEFGPESGRAIDARVTTDAAERDRFWELRKAGLPLLLSRTSDDKHVAFVEDAAVPPEALPAFVSSFRALLDRHDTSASFYGHAGPGVLHVRPLIDTTDDFGRERMRDIAEGVFDLVQAHDGSISGEHGDGRSRTEFTARQYTPEVHALFRDLKDTLDPTGRLNPGPVVGNVHLDEDHRIEPDDEVTVPFDPFLHWENENGLRGMIELCHGCGGCQGSQAVAGGVMCPTYRASEEEITSTRGRANLLREAIRGHLDPEELLSEHFQAEVLDLCIGCKGCLTDCPSGVDMAKLKAELRYQRTVQDGPTRRQRLFGSLPRLARWGSRLAPVSNWLTRVPGRGRLQEALFGIARGRTPPRFAGTPMATSRTESDRESEQHVVLVVDPYTNYFAPESGRATKRLLEAANVAVDVEPVASLGRAAFSQGLLDHARDRAVTALETLEPKVEAGSTLVVPEPAAAAMLQADYVSLLGSARATPVANATFGPLAYLDHIGADLPLKPRDDPVAVHGHCQAHSVANGRDLETIVEDYGYTVTPLDSGCCGMAGSFGYEAEHQAMSRAIGGILEDQLEECGPTHVLAAGFSCRRQLAALDIQSAVSHPVNVLAADLA